MNNDNENDSKITKLPRNKNGSNTIGEVRHNKGENVTPILKNRNEVDKTKELETDNKSDPVIEVESILESNETKIPRTENEMIKVGYQCRSISAKGHSEVVTNLPIGSSIDDIVQASMENVSDTVACLAEKNFAEGGIRIRKIVKTK